MDAAQRHTAALQKERRKRLPVSVQPSKRVTEAGAVVVGGPAVFDSDATHLLLPAFVAGSLYAGLAFLIMVAMVTVIVFQSAAGTALVFNRPASLSLGTANRARWAERRPSAGNNWRAVHAPAKGATASQPSQFRTTTWRCERRKHGGAAAQGQGWVHASWRGSCTGRYRVAQAAGVIYIVREECSQDQIEELDDVVDSTVDGGEGGGPTAEAMLAMYGVEGWTRLGGGGKPTQSISLYGVASSHQLAALLHNGLNGWLAANGCWSRERGRNEKKKEGVVRRGGGGP